MKKIKTLFAIAVLSTLSLVLTSCEDAGETTQSLTGNENNLPDELKGLKIYRVSTGAGDYVKVAVLEDKINSTTYSVGKIQQSTIIVNRQSGKLIEVSQILVENDSLIVCRK